MINPNSIVLKRQQPLRARYAHDPAEAVTVKHGTTRTTGGVDALHGVVAPGDVYDLECRYGIDAAIGGLDDAPNPGDLLCAALAACQDSTIRMVADILGVTIESLEVAVVGDVDVRGCMAVDRGVKVGFRSLACNVKLTLAPGTDPQRAAALREQAERSCVNLDTLRSGVPVAIAFEMSGAQARTAA
jgi:uncharacterized OsmC-like protein